MLIGRNHPNGKWHALYWDDLKGSAPVCSGGRHMRIARFNRKFKDLGPGYVAYCGAVDEVDQTKYGKPNCKAPSCVAAYKQTKARGRGCSKCGAFGHNKRRCTLRRKKKLARRRNKR